MAIRTTPEAVFEIMDVDVDVPLTPFIRAASQLVDRVAKADEEARARVNGIFFLDPVTENDPTVEQQIATIETWLAAHFYAMRKPRAASEGAGSVSASYQSQVSLNLYLSHYGQMAMVLDVTGTLRELSDGLEEKTPRVASVSWLGR